VQHEYDISEVKKLILLLDDETIIQNAEQLKELTQYAKIYIKLEDENNDSEYLYKIKETTKQASNKVNIEINANANVSNKGNRTVYDCPVCQKKVTSQHGMRHLRKHELSDVDARNIASVSKFARYNKLNIDLHKCEKCGKFVRNIFLHNKTHNVENKVLTPHEKINEILDPVETTLMHHLKEKYGNININHVKKPALTVENQELILNIQAALKEYLVHPQGRAKSVNSTLEICCKSFVKRHITHIKYIFETSEISNEMIFDVNILSIYLENNRIRNSSKSQYISRFLILCECVLFYKTKALMSSYSSIFSSISDFNINNAMTMAKQLKKPISSRALADKLNDDDDNNVTITDDMMRTIWEQTCKTIMKYDSVFAE